MILQLEFFLLPSSLLWLHLKLLFIFAHTGIFGYMA